MKKTKRKVQMQLKIDFSLPYELTPTLEDILYEIKLTGTTQVPLS